MGDSPSGEMLLAIKACVRNGRLLRYRKEANLSQLEAAELAGVTLSAWGELERMNFSKASVEQVVRVAALLDCEPEDIYPPELRGMNLGLDRVLYRGVSPKLVAAERRYAGMLPQEDRQWMVEAKMMLNEAMEELTDRERQVVKLLNGIDCEKHTLLEAGKVVGVTRERVRQIHISAMYHIERFCRNAVLPEELRDKLPVRKKKEKCDEKAIPEA